MSESAILFTLDDPRESAREAPYTFILPSADRLQAIRAGDQVKVVFRPAASGTKWDAERMWVTVTAIGDDVLRGVLANQPDDIPGLSLGANVIFERWHVIDVDFQDPADDERYPHSDRREYWERCLVDSAVLQGELKVDYLYREEPDLAGPDDKYPDSGWRIRGDMRDTSDEEVDAREAKYIAIGAVLNKDDSWLHLIDEPVGAAFRRNLDSGEYVGVHRQPTTIQ